MTLDFDFDVEADEVTLHLTMDTDTWRRVFETYRDVSSGLIGFAELFREHEDAILSKVAQLNQ